ncbi:MAG: Transcriptional regulator, GntR family domain / Aspartate aminotransferase (EC [uncultured Caballeronia sp.]|nr:MAG: Transcriptional regulator, GntR family domain / Aspartate aminotransferase (EC [uncultured Caballeronia sp.]
MRPRDRLPGLRDLANELQLNYTTVARAYAEARKRGLLDSVPATARSYAAGPRRCRCLAAAVSR